MEDNISSNVCPRCGEIWMCNLINKDGSIQNGYRPVFILSNDKNNTYSTTVNVIPITSRIKKKQLPIHVELENYRQCGLILPSTMLIEQIMTVSVHSLDRCIGKVDDFETLQKIRNAISIQFPILSAV